MVRCRLGSFRMKYAVQPGLYALGSPDNTSDVFVTANYKLSFDMLRRSLSGTNAWVLALDTRGINVWCAAGKGTFGAEEMIKRVNETGLKDIVSHRKLIVPQLGSVGVAAHEVKRATNFHVYWGPVRATDIKGYIEAGYKATEAMRRVEFTLTDRLVLTPMEFIPAMKALAIFSVIILALFGLSPSGMSFTKALEGSSLLALGALTIFTGAVLTPALLPFIPFRAFSIKGWIAGMAASVIFMAATAIGPLVTIASLIFFPLASSYIALQFTGASTFTSVSGVKKELKYALPVYIAGLAISLALLITHKITGWS